MSLKLKQKELELARVRMARQELEYKVLERKEEIERVEQNIKVQLEAEERLKKELQDLSK